MNKRYVWYQIAILSLLLLLGAISCADKQGGAYIKAGQQYCETSFYTWRGRWWDYYERGTSCAAGQFWSEAIADFQAAIRQRPEDQYRARTYALHVLDDYFPHRELGIVYYHQGRYQDAIRELTLSLSQVDTAKAKTYLNESRRLLLHRDGGDQPSPSIVLDGLADEVFTNRLSFDIKGYAQSGAYIQSLSINGQAQFVELAEQRVPFVKTVEMRDGLNTIRVAAGDLLDQQAHLDLTIHVDRQGPLISLQPPKSLRAQPPRLLLQGLLFDRSGIVRFTINGRRLRLPPAIPGATVERAAWIPGATSPPFEVEEENGTVRLVRAFREEISVAPGMTSVSFEVQDKAGNVTTDAISLLPSAGRKPEIRQGRQPLRRGWRRASLESNPAMFERVAFRPAAVISAQTMASQTPQIKLYDELEDLANGAGITVYNEHSEPCGKESITVSGNTMTIRGVAISGSAIEKLSIHVYAAGQRKSHDPYVWQRQDPRRARKRGVLDTLLRYFDRGDIDSMFQRVAISWEFKLKKGENKLVLEAVDAVGRHTQHTITVYYKGHFKSLPRLRVYLPDEPAKSTKSKQVEDDIYIHLQRVLLDQKRFKILTNPDHLNTILKKYKWTNRDLRREPKAAKVGKSVQAESILTWEVFGSPEELGILVHLVDADIEERLVHADIDGLYERDLFLSNNNLYGFLQRLAQKLEREFPIVSGCIEAKSGKNLRTTLPHDKLKEHMKLLIFREEAAFQNATLPIEARITTLSERPEAILLTADHTKDVQQFDRIITK